MDNKRTILSVRRTNKYIYANLSDATGRVLGGVRGRDAAVVGDQIAKIAKDKGLIKITFDRGQLRYHGLVKLLAEAARKAGLDF